MAQVSMTVRMDSQLKARFDELCSQFGMSANTAMNVFANAVVRKRKIPFEIDAKAPETRSDGWKAFWELREEAQRNGVPDLTLDEINEEIRLAREERRAKESK